MTAGWGVGYTAFMQEPEIRESLLAMRRKLVRERESISKQIQACDTLLAGLSAEASAMTSEPGANGEADVLGKATPGTPAETADPASAPTASVEKPPFLSAEDRMALLIRAGSKGHGAITARVELAVAECGETFTMPEVLERYRSIGAQIFRTDQDGAVTLETDGTSINVRTFTGHEFALH